MAFLNSKYVCSHKVNQLQKSKKFVFMNDPKMAFLNGLKTAFLNGLYLLSDEITQFQKGQKYVFTNDLKMAFLNAEYMLECTFS